MFIALFSGGFILFFGLGWLIVGPLLYDSVVPKKAFSVSLQDAALILLCGIMVNYGLVLCFQSLHISLFIESILSSIGLLCFAFCLFRWCERRTFLSSISWKKTIGIILLVGFYAIQILTKPLVDWDARSIWFFHAKLIYAAGSLSEVAGWGHSSVALSHVDYPKLVPVLAAQITYVRGFWNEYLPKASLLFIFVPAILWLFTFASRSLSFVVLLMFFPLSLHSSLWTGYMDGYLTLYFSLSMLLFGRYIISSRPIDIMSSGCCLLLLLNIKNEGILAVLAGFCSMIFISKSLSLIRLNTLFISYKRMGVALLVWLSPFMVWTFYKHRWNFYNDLQIGSMQSLAKIYSRLTDGSWWVIVSRSFEELQSALLLLGVMYLALRFQKKSAVRESLPALLAGGIYYLGMITIYLLTPHDLIWHLNTSISRTMLAVKGCLWIGIFFMLNALERPSDG